MMTLASVGRRRFFQMLFVRLSLKHGECPSTLLIGVKFDQHDGRGNEKLVLEVPALQTREAFTPARQSLEFDSDIGVCD